MTNEVASTPELPFIGSRRDRIVVLLILITLALSTRMLPLATSPYPFNNDGITECRIASTILESGELNLSDAVPFSYSNSMVTPIYDVTLAFIAGFVGTDPFWVAQVVVSFLSVLTVICGYWMGLAISRSVKGALLAALVFSLFGTFVFLTGSAWKESLGVALLMLLVFAYMGRSSKRMFALELMLLAVLPLIHHLVTVIAYLALAYLAMWSFIYAYRAKRLGRRQMVDILVILSFSMAAYIYYYTSPLERVSYISSEIGFTSMVAIFLSLATAAALFLSRKRHFRFTLAPIPAIVVFAMFAWDHFNPIFPYSQGTPPYVLMLGATASILICVAWYGFEKLHSSSTMSRAIPLCLLLPVLTLFAFAFAIGGGISGHQILYRSFDFADISLALGVAATVGYFGKRPKLQTVLIVVVTLALVVSFPFAYLTEPLKGVRHDTQEYEVDALDWLYFNGGTDPTFRSDERISYLAMVLRDFGKNPYLALDLSMGTPPAYIAFSALLERWSSVGVNAYPNGHVVIDEDYLQIVLQASNVMYIGGPNDDTITIFRYSDLGEKMI